MIAFHIKMAKRMVLVPEEQQALAYQQKHSISPQLRSIANIDTLMNYLLYSSKLPQKRKMRLYNQLNIQKQNISRQFGDVGIAPSMQIAQARLPTPTRRTLVGHEEPIPRPVPNYLRQAPGRALLPPGSPLTRSRSLTRASSRVARPRTRSLSAPRRPIRPPTPPPPAQPIAVPQIPPPASRDTIQRTRKRKRARPEFKPSPITRSRSRTLAVDPRSLVNDWNRLRRR